MTPPEAPGGGSHETSVTPAGINVLRLAWMAGPMDVMTAGIVQTRLGRGIRFLARRLARAAFVVAPLVPNAVHAACRLEDFAAIAVTMVGMRPTVHVTLDGQDALFLVETGAFASGLSPEAADRYHIRVFQRGVVGVEGIGGDIFAQTARVETVQL